jgi:hypothetical protein
MSKYVLSWTNRLTGSAAENEAAVKRNLELFTKWEPAPGTTISPFLNCVDGSGGFAVVETDDPAELLDAAAKFGTLIDFKAYPVIDINEAVQVMQEGIAFRESVG